MSLLELSSAHAFIIQVIELNEANLENCLGLQQAILDALPPDQDKIHPKSREKFESLLSGVSGSILGIFQDDQLVAQAIMLRPQTTEEADLIDFQLPAAPTEVTTLSGVLTHPAYERRGFMTHLVNFWLHLAASEGRPHACAIVTRDNTASWSGFMNGGLVITAATYDLSDNSTVYLLHRDISCGPVLSREAQKTLSSSARNGEYHPMDYRILSPSALLEEANRHFAEGYIGIERVYERDNPDVVLVHRACLNYYLGIK